MCQDNCSGITVFKGTDGVGISQIIDNGDGSITIYYTNGTTFTTSATFARPYKCYTALLTQTGTSDPVATVLENTLGVTPTWTRDAVGKYYANLGAGVFLPAQSASFISGMGDLGSADNDVKVKTLFGTAGVYGPYIVSTALGSFSDGVLSNAVIEIRIYN